MSRALPSGRVTFLFTDVEGSTKLLHDVGAADYARALDEHRRIVREAIASHDGVEVDTQGDAFFVAFADAAEAIAAACEVQERLTGAIRVRMGLHTGTPHVTGDGYVGDDVHLGARIAAAGHGGQVLLSSATRALLEPSNSLLLSDLGEHRLKDFAAPVAIFQLGDDRFPPLKTISNTNLPRPASSFVGREREVAQITQALQGGARLLTLTGPGGTGKTRLALEAAAELVPEFKAGVFWVGLATLRDPALVIETIGQTLGASDGVPAHIAEREMLLLLDNLEQVMDAAPDLVQLVEMCPNLRLLVTSRELLRVRGEVEYPVLPLVDADAVELFCARARVDADDAVYELCRALDNLPLAVELAAARTNVLTAKQIVERLTQRLDLLKGGRDADPRQQTLRATIEWSHELLNDEERRLFARLAVFRGGCTLEDAEEVCRADLDALQSLVDKSLVRSTENRFWMLETIREYALERLDASGEEDQVRRRYTDHFLALAERAQPHLWPRDSKEWADRLTREHDNFRSVFEYLERAGRTQDALALAGNLHEVWGSFLAEGRRLAEAALAADERPTLARARALLAAGDMAMGQADEAAVKLRAEQALELFRRLGDDAGAGYALFMMGHTLAEEEEFAAARDVAEEAVRLWERLGDEHGVMQAKWLLTWAWRGLGDDDRADSLIDELLGLARTLGNLDLLSVLLSGGHAHRKIDEGDIRAAIAMLEEAFEICRERDDVWRLTHVASGVAHVLAAVGRQEAAARVLASERALFEEIGGSPPGHVAREDEKTLALVHAGLDGAAFDAAWREGSKLEAGEAVALALESLR